jgi:hypothetical protein
MQKEIKNPPTQETKYGTYIPQFFKKGDFGTYSFRYDLWRSKNSGEETLESIMCNGDNDLTPVVNIADSYFPECYGCWAGVAHTEAKHEDSRKLIGKI